MPTGQPPTSASVSYRQQFTRCGKLDCLRCAPGLPGHGPYWYAYWREGGRVRSRYLGKQPPVDARHVAAERTATPTEDGPAEPRMPPVAARADVPAALRVRTLGGFAVWRGGVPIPPASWERRKARALFKALLDAPHHRLHRDQAIELLWPEADAERAAARLRVTVYHLRRILDGSGERAVPGDRYLPTEGEWIALRPAPGAEPDPHWWDGAAFAAAAAAALAGHDADACRAALHLYTGPYLPDDPYEGYAAARREALQARYLSLLLHLADLCIEHEETSEALRCLHAALDADPCHEAATRTLMRLTAGTGRRTEAIRAYRQLQTALKKELGVGPDALTLSYYQQIVESVPPPVPTPAVVTPVQPPIDALSAGSLRGPLVGRLAELTALETCLSGAFDGRSALVLISGEAGAGKSRLLAECLRGARRRGGLVLYGRAYRMEGQLPYGPLLEALRSYVAVQSPALLRAQVETHGPALLSLLPELAVALPDLAPPAPLDPAAERHRLFAALGGMLHEMCRTMPVVVALEDLHWTDVTTLQGIHFLARTCRELPLLLLGTYRREDLALSPPLAGLVTELRRETLATVLTLEPLSLEHTKRLVEALLSPHPIDEDAVRLVVARAQGNLLYVEELVAALQEDGHLTLRDGCWQRASREIPPAPASIRALIEERVRRLDETGGKVLRLCAVLNRDADYRLLCAACELDEERLLDVLEAATAAGLLEETTTGYRLYHPLAQEALYQGIAPRRRALLHRRAGEALLTCYGEQTATHAAELAYHFAEAAVHAQAVRYALLASEQAAASLATPEAIAHLTTARRHLALLLESADPDGRFPPTRLTTIDERLGDLRQLAGEFAVAADDFARARQDEPDPVRQAELWRKEGVTWTSRGEYTRALAIFAQAAEISDQHQPLPAVIHASLELSRAAALYRRGDYEEATTAVTRARRFLEDEPDEALLARAAHLLGQIAMDKGEYDAAVTQTQQRLAGYERLGDQYNMARALDSLGVIAYRRAAYPEAEEFCRRSAAICKRIGDLVELHWAVNNLGLIALRQGEPDLAERYLRESLAIRTSIGDQQGIASSWNNLGDLIQYLGDLEGAEEYHHRALALREQIGEQWRIAFSLHCLGTVAEERGDLEQAAEWLERSLALRRRLGDQWGIANSLASLALVALDREDPTAEAMLREALTIFEQLDDKRGSAACWAELAVTALMRGDAAEAHSLARRARRQAARLGTPDLEAQAALAMADAALWAGRFRLATAAQRRGQAVAEAHRASRMTVAALLCRARLHRTLGDTDGATTTAAQALVLASAGGRQRDEEAARRLLAGLTVA